MRTALYFLVVAGSVALGLTSAGACTSSFQATGGGSSSSATSNSTGGSTGTAGGGGSSSSCQASFPLADGAKVGDGCGVFVSATTGSSAGDGSLEQPFNAFADALKVAKGKPIFLCGDFDESVAVRASTDVYGGMSCPNSGAWTYNQKMRSTINGRPGYPGIAVVNTTAKFSAHSLTINASSSVLAGSSAIGVSIDKGVQASLSFCEIVAGDGHDGADGKKPDTTGMDGVDGAKTGQDAPTNSCGGVAKGGAGGKNVCSTGTTTGGDGGKGGEAGQLDGGDGMNGVPFLVGHGDGGFGAGWNNGVKCGDGQPGLMGATGDPGEAGKDTTLAVEGVLGGNGHAGSVGAIGHGGGGGGGSPGATGCPGGGNGRGASGGGGGSGGCGGPGGTAPTAGGSSVALLVVGGTITVDHLTLTVGHAGKGGDGAAGGQGGGGGDGADPGSNSSGVALVACGGGKGGAGGQGGPSGGARGGHAVGIAFGEMPTSTSFDVTFNQGLHGDPGMGADGSDPGAQGAGGACWDFQKNKACGG